MTLLNPAALFFAALAPVIVLLYLLKLRRLPARVSTLMFWQRVTADNRRRALFQRLRQLLSLLLHLLIFTLLLFALARPELAAFRVGTGAGSSTVILLDCRAQMQARHGGETYFAAARLAAEGYLRRASARSPVALLAAGSAPRVLAGFSGDEKALLGGLEHAAAVDAGGKIEDAIKLADDLLAARSGERRIVVLTDHSPAEVETKTASTRSTVEWHPVNRTNAPRENVGITRLTARPLPNSPQTDEVMLELENFGPTRQSGSVELSLDARTLDVKPYDLAPGERRTEIYPALAARGNLANARGWVTAHLVPGAGTRDALALDDDAFAVIPPSQPLRVLLVTRGNWFLEGIFKADEQIEFNQLAPDNFQAAQAAGFDAVVLDDVLPPGFEDLESLPPGNFLFVRQAPAPLGGMPSTPPVDRPVVTDTDKDSPLLRLVDLRDIAFIRAQAWTLPAAGGWRFGAPVRSLEGPLVVTGERTSQSTGGSRKAPARFVALAFSPTDSVELPLRVAFPLFVRNTVAFLGRRDGPAADDLAGGSGLRAGETLRLAAGETIWQKGQLAYGPLTGEIPAAEILSGPTIFEPEKNGFYLRRGTDGVAHWLAVNTFDRQVSALNAAASPSPANNEGASQGKSIPAQVHWLSGWIEAVRVWPPWIYLAVTALVICTLEWWGFHRRRTE